MPSKLPRDDGPHTQGAPPWLSLSLKYAPDPARAGALTPYARSASSWSIQSASQPHAVSEDTTAIAGRPDRATVRQPDAQIAPVSRSISHAPAIPARWAGAAGERLRFGEDSFVLSFCYIGPSETDDANPTVIDPRCQARDVGVPTKSRPKGLRLYRDWTWDEQLGYLRWVGSGRQAAEVPREYLLQVVCSLEHAIVRDALRDDLVHVREELARLLQLHRADITFADAARRLISATEFLDPAFIPSTVYATASAANHAPEIPFSTKHFLGWMLQHSNRLESDAALLYYLQQPGTRLSLHEAQCFRELHGLWCHLYPHEISADFAASQSAPPLRLDYQPLVGNFAGHWSSPYPDVAALVLPESYHELFNRCSESVAHLKDVPVGRLLANVPLHLGSDGHLSDALPERRLDAAARLQDLLNGLATANVMVDQLVSAVFEEVDLQPHKLLPAKLQRLLANILDEEGFAFQPDARLSLPSTLRPDGQVVLYASESLPNDGPNDAYYLAQSAVILSSLSQQWYPGLDGLQLEELEQRLPYWHRYSDRELRRLEATREAITLLPNHRAYLLRWVKILLREKRLKDLVFGFGIAFKGQRRNMWLAKFARSVSLAAEALIDEHELLASASDCPSSSVAPHQDLEARASGLLGTATAQRTEYANADAVSPYRTGSILLEGPETRHVQILLALNDRSRSYAELAELVKARGLSMAATLECINEWAILEFGAPAIEVGDNCSLSGTASAYLSSLMDAS